MTRDTKVALLACSLVAGIVLLSWGRIDNAIALLCVAYGLGLLDYFIDHDDNDPSGTNPVC